MPKAKGRVRLVVAIDDVSFRRGLFHVEMGSAKKAKIYAMPPNAAYRLYGLLHEEINRSAGQIEPFRKEVV